MNRRRAITVLGAATFAGCKRATPLHTFSGFAFGTAVHFQVHGISEAEFQSISAKCSARLREIEALFSLYDPQSTISILNRDGRVENPPGEFLDLIQTALEYGKLTGGIFDITVQPLWDWRQKWKAANLTERAEMSVTTWGKALALVDHRNVRITGSSVVFGKKSMAVTLNGIVQGYATDQIITLLKKGGVTNALVNIGEYSALGNAPDGKSWRIELSATGKEIDLPSGRSLAVSAGSGYTFDPEGRFHHIFRPTDGMNTRPDSTIVVTAPTATIADALSTTFTVASDDERRKILVRFPNTTFQEIRARN